MTDERLLEIRSAAREMFSTRGYNGTSMRDIAAAVGINIATLYHYHRDKQALFSDVMAAQLTELKAGLEAAIAAGETPEERVRLMLRWIVRYNGTKVGMTLTSELRFVDDEHRDAIVQLRDRLQRLVEGVIREGVEEGRFTVPDAKLAAYLFFAIGYSVSMWYRPGGRLSPEDIGDAYGDIILGGLTGAVALGALPTAATLLTEVRGAT